MGRRTWTGILAALLLLTAGCAAGSAPLSYGDAFYSSQGSYQTDSLHCPSGQGDTLEVSFRNDGEHTCQVILYQQGLFGTRTERDAITVTAGAERAFCYPASDGKTFVVRVNSLDGGEVEGGLSLSQKHT
ncbi:hypothetical protein B5G43_10380 [Flavonifractor sp. An92]|uniref:hypothetical protein n=1 Tax=Flavonifractor sp. An92 TaxID=1965666 RepID=UPI000B368FCF|nr:MULTISPECIES: hypothetical protein [unclassified Flavonifractor]OUN06165.1 hypothetical protein B5G43_10380 [Flavonifractor sp. An92]OUQ22623.1 hypothetical protein B5E80_12885 [Flavonifractor sp. An135]